MEQTAERFGAVSRRGGEGESVRAALEELIQRGKEVSEAIAGAQHGCCPASSRETVYVGEDPEQATVQKWVTDRRGEVKAGRYDGRSDWEAYRAKSQIVAQANGWSQRERAVRLIAALEGKALWALLDLNEMELADSQAVLTALDRRFGSAEPAAPGVPQLTTRREIGRVRCGGALPHSKGIPLLQSGGPGRSGD
ncbi:UNVERIFIED_CONTAM: hypothetical protein FKN15_056962 [Acipenser sinensis]